MKILVIEDNPNHIADVQNFFQTEPLPFPIEVEYAEDLETAKRGTQYIGFRRYDLDGIMSDLFFPQFPGQKLEDIPTWEDAGGTAAVWSAHTSKIPIVIVTSIYHHGKKAKKECEELRRCGIEMFDCFHTDLARNEQGEVAHKAWRPAFYGLVYTILGIRSGEYKLPGGNELKHKSGEVRYLVGHNLKCSDPIVQQMLELGFSFDDLLRP